MRLKKKKASSDYKKVYWLPELVRTPGTHQAMKCNNTGTVVMSADDLLVIANEISQRIRHQ